MAFYHKMVFKSLIFAILGTKCKNMATISTFLSNKHVRGTWVITTVGNHVIGSWSPKKLHGKLHLTIKMVVKNLMLAILSTHYKNMAPISPFLSNKSAPVTLVLAKDRQSCYWELESPKLHGEWHFTIKTGLQKPYFGHFSTKCKNVATISTFLSNNGVRVTRILKTFTKYKVYKYGHHFHIFVE
jgi:hypothetical protein